MFRLIGISLGLVGMTVAGGMSLSFAHKALHADAPRVQLAALGPDAATLTFGTTRVEGVQRVYYRSDVQDVVPQAIVPRVRLAAVDQADVPRLIARDLPALPDAMAAPDLSSRPPERGTVVVDEPVFAAVAAPRRTRAAAPARVAAVAPAVTRNVTSIVARVPGPPSPSYMIGVYR